jgi:hypothetical protein
MQLPVCKTQNCNRAVTAIISCASQVLGRHEGVLAVGEDRQGNSHALCTHTPANVLRSGQAAHSAVVRPCQGTAARLIFGGSWVHALPSTPACRTLLG